MSSAKIQSRCECQSTLLAEVDESGRVSGGVVRLSSGALQKAPATGVQAGEEQFQVGWLCSVCGRNTSRLFYRGALNFV